MSKAVSQHSSPLAKSRLESVSRGLQSKHAPSAQDLNQAIRYVQARVFSYRLEQSVPRTLPEMSSVPILPPVRSSRNGLGPGTYTIRDSPSGPSFQFSSVRRFDYSPLAGQRSVSPRRKLHQPSEEKEKWKSIQRDYRGLLCREIKESLAQEKAARLRSRLQDKLRRLDYKVNKQAYDYFRKKWITAFSVVGLATVLQCKLQLKKRMKEVITQRISWLLAISRGAGQFKIALRSIRQRQAWSSLECLLTPLLYRKAAKLRIQMHSRLTSVLAKANDNAALLEAITQWKNSLVRIQRNVRNWLVTRKARLVVLELLWRAVVPTKLQVMSEELLEVYLQRFVEYAINDYFERVDYYEQNKERLKLEYFQAKYLLDLEGMHSSTVVQPTLSKPRKPTLILFSQAKLKRFLGKTAHFQDDPRPRRRRRDRSQKKKKKKTKKHSQRRHTTRSAAPSKRRRGKATDRLLETENSPRL